MSELTINYKLASSPKEFSDARKIILDYVEWLGMDLSFQNFEAEISDLAKMYSTPHGGLVLAYDEDRVIGIAGIRCFEGETGELKRMFVSEAYRHAGVGKKILEQSIALAKALKYKRVRLDTHDSMQAAIKIYKSFGFEEIDPYRYNPHEGIKFFELAL